jgi:hypothetical protein
MPCCRGRPVYLFSGLNYPWPVPRCTPDDASGAMLGLMERKHTEGQAEGQALERDKSPHMWLKTETDLPPRTTNTGASCLQLSITRYIRISERSSNPQFSDSTALGLSIRPVNCFVTPQIFSGRTRATTTPAVSYRR